MQQIQPHQVTAEVPDRRGLSRRRFLAIGVGGTLALSVAGTQLRNSYVDSRAAWIEQVVRKNLPGIELDEASLDLFVRTLLAGKTLNSRAHRIAVFTQQAMPWLAMRVSKIRGALQRRERLVLTEFLIGSNFFRVADPKRERIVYYGAPVACQNPFASFA